MIKEKVKLSDYVVIDIENPNTKADSICSIAIIKVEDGKKVYEEYTLINPEDRFDEINMRVNKISPSMVKDAITFDEFWNKYGNIITNNTIVGHGIKYDISVISKTLKKYGIELPTLKIVCTQKLSQKYLDTDQYRLDKVCNYLNIELQQHHNALFDTKACMKILEYINNNYGLDEEDIEEYYYDNNTTRSSGMRIIYSDDTQSLQILKKIIESIMSDEQLELDEINDLNEWLDSNTQLIGNYPFDKIYSIVKKVIEDGNITEEEHKELFKVFSDFINPVQEEKSNETIIFNDKLFCLTGTFNSGSKDEIEEKINDKGGIVGKGVTSKTNYLIVGGAGSDAWKFGNYGGKVQKAMELKEKGKDIEIISEEDFIKNI